MRGLSWCVSYMSCSTGLNFCFQVKVSTEFIVAGKKSLLSAFFFFFLNKKYDFRIPKRYHSRNLDHSTNKFWAENVEMTSITWLKKRKFWKNRRQSFSTVLIAEKKMNLRSKTNCLISEYMRHPERQWCLVSSEYDIPKVFPVIKKSLITLTWRKARRFGGRRTAIVSCGTISANERIHFAFFCSLCGPHNGSYYFTWFSSVGEKLCLDMSRCNHCRIRFFPKVSSWYWAFWKPRISRSDVYKWP